MKKTLKWFGIFALAALIGFSMTGCPVGGGSGSSSGFGEEDLPNISIGDGKVPADEDELKAAMKYVFPKLQSIYDAVEGAIGMAMLGPMMAAYYSGEDSISIDEELSDDDLVSYSSVISGLKGRIKGSATMSSETASFSWDPSFDIDSTDYSGNFIKGKGKVNGTRNIGSSSSKTSNDMVYAIAFNNGTLCGKAIIELSVSYTEDDDDNIDPDSFNGSGHVIIYDADNEQTVQRPYTKDELKEIFFN